MKALALPILLFGFIFTSLAGWQSYIKPDSLVVGGVYTIHRGQVLSGDLDGVFSQIILEDGARVTGEIRSLSSVLDLAGTVDGAIFAVGSDVIVRETAALAQSPRQLETIHYVVLLPPMTRTGNALR
jgi:hypothetical protein